MTTDWYELIPGLKEFDVHNKKSNPEPEVWVCLEGNLSLALSYSTIFWPEFVEIGGMVFQKGTTKEHVENWLSNNSGNKRSVEWVINHIHLQDIHGAFSQATAKQLIYLGRVLKDMLACKLQRDFPEKKFVVEFIEDGIENLADYQVSFFQTDHETG